MKCLQITHAFLNYFVPKRSTNALFFLYGLRGCLLFNVYWVIPHFLFLESSHSCNACLNMRVCAMFPQITTRQAGRRETAGWKPAGDSENEISRPKHLSDTRTRHKTTVFILPVEDLTWLDICYFFLLPWDIVLSMCPKQREQKRGATMGQLCTRFPFCRTIKCPKGEEKNPSSSNLQTAEGFNSVPMFKREWNKIQRNKRDLLSHGVSSSVVVGTKHRMIFKTHINHLLLLARQIEITTVLLLKKKD